MKNQTNLKQVIIACTDQVNDNDMMLALSKAPLSLVTRCFEGGKNFMGRHEGREYQKVVIDWTDNHDMKTEIRGATSDDVLAYFWTVEMMGCPCQKIEINNKLKCIAFGPYDADTLDDILCDVSPYTP